MKLLVTAIFFFFLTGNAISQDLDSLEKDWYFMMLSYGNVKDFHHFDLDHKKLELRIESDSVKRKVTLDSSEIHAFFESLKKVLNEKTSNPITDAKYDKWSEEKAAQIWYDYSNYQFDRRSNEIAIAILQDFNWLDNRNALIIEERHHQKRKHLSFNIYSEEQTIRLESRTPFKQFELEYKSADTIIYSDKLLAALEDLFQFKDSSSFETTSIEKIQVNYAFEVKIKDSINNYWLHEILDEKEFNFLTNRVFIQNPVICSKETIDWGKRNAVRFLTPSTFHGNIWYSLIFAYPNLEKYISGYEPKDFFSERTRYKRRLDEKFLDKNQVIEYCQKNFQSKGIIHYVRNRSFSFKARRDFKSDFKASGQDKHLYKGKLKHAILFELQEGEHNDLQYHEKLKNVSYWVFLEDGTIILWQSSGDKIMNFPQEFVNGTNCKVISKEDFTLYETKN